MRDAFLFVHLPRARTYREQAATRDALHGVDPGFMHVLCCAEFKDLVAPPATEEREHRRAEKFVARQFSYIFVLGSCTYILPHFVIAGNTWCLALRFFAAGHWNPDHVAPRAGDSESLR